MPVERMFLVDDVGQCEIIQQFCKRTHINLQPRYIPAKRQCKPDVPVRYGVTFEMTGLQQKYPVARFSGMPARVEVVIVIEIGGEGLINGKSRFCW